MKYVVAALVAVTSPITAFDRQQRNCEQRFADNDFAEYGVCVTQAGQHEQREFKRLIAAAMRDHKISPARFEAWSNARDRRCKKGGQSVPNVNGQPVAKARCIARADDKLLKSLQIKRH